MTKAPVFPEQRFILISRHKVDVKIPGINVAGRVFFGDNVDHGLVGKVSGKLSTHMENQKKHQQNI
jgi:hypothetical protein